MIDNLFISPLGWSEHVWDKIITDERFNSKSFEIVEFLNDSFENISKKHINEYLIEKLNSLSKKGV